MVAGGGRRDRDYGLDRSSIRLIVCAMDWPFATHASSLARAFGVSITAICLPPASVRDWRLLAWRSVESGILRAVESGGLVALVRKLPGK